MKLFKYVSSERIDILTNGYIRFTQPLVWNDPFESQPNYIDHKDKNPFQMLLKLVGMVKHHESTGNNPPKEQIDEYEKERTRVTKDDIYSYINRNIVGLSLTEDNSDLLMWAHYASNHSGFVIEFDVEHDFFKKDGTCIFKVKCGEERPNVNTFDFASVIVELVQSLETNIAISQEKYKIISQIFKKSSSWSYEKEWRLVTSVKNASNYDKIKKELNVIHLGNIRQEDQYVALFPIPISCIKTIYCGNRMETSKIRKLHLLTKYNTVFSHIKLMYAELDNLLYKINFNEVTAYKALRPGEIYYENKNDDEKLRCKNNYYEQRYENEISEIKKIKPIEV